MQKCCIVMPYFSVRTKITRMNEFKQNEKVNLIDDIRNISKKVKGHGFVPDNFYEVAAFTGKLCEIMDISPLQAILLSAVITVNLDTERHCTIKKLSGFFSCSTLDMFARINEFDVLVRKELIKKDMEEVFGKRALGDYHYEISSDVFLALQNNDMGFFSRRNKEGINIAGFFKNANNLFMQLKNSGILLQLYYKI